MLQTSMLQMHLKTSTKAVENIGEAIRDFMENKIANKIAGKI